MVIERDSLKEANEELKCCQIQMKKTGSIEHSQTSANDDIESAIDLKSVNKLNTSIYIHVYLFYFFYSI